MQHQILLRFKNSIPYNIWLFQPLISPLHNSLFYFSPTHKSFPPVFPHLLIIFSEYS